MNPTKTDDANDRSLLSDVLIHVIGPNQLQNELLTCFLEENLEPAVCRQHQVLDDSFKAALRSAQHHLLLFDCLGDKKTDPWRLYQLNGIAATPNYFLSFYNVHPEAGIENRAIAQGIHGLFYKQESYKTIPKAISAILDGELWFSRKTMSQCLVNGKVPSNRIITDMASCLTDREREILIAIATGIGNQEIADELRISLHTVKTHIYNIYKKINVKNRLQASLWAARYV